MLMWRFRILLGVTAVALLTAHWLQPVFLYFPRKYSDREREGLKWELHRRQLAISPIAYTTGEGAQYSYLVHTADMVSGSKLKMLMFLGGNGMTAFDAAAWLVGIRQHLDDNDSFVLLAVDYPGYGANGGSPSPSAIQDAVNTAFEKSLDHLKTEHSASVSEVIVVGHSIGSGVATRWVASLTPAHPAVPIRSLVLSAPFTSIADMASHIFGVPRLLSPLISRHNWDNVSALRTITSNGNGVVGGRISIIHGKRDEIVPFDMGVQLSQIDETKIDFVPISSRTHNDILDLYAQYAVLINPKSRL